MPRHADEQRRALRKGRQTPRTNGEIDKDCPEFVPQIRSDAPLEEKCGRSKLVNQGGVVKACVHWLRPLRCRIWPPLSLPLALGNTKRRLSATSASDPLRTQRVVGSPRKMTHTGQRPGTMRGRPLGLPDGPPSRALGRPFPEKPSSWLLDVRIVTAEDALAWRRANLAPKS